MAMTDERRIRQEAARKLWSEGKTVEEISTAMNLNYMTIRNYVCKMPDYGNRKRQSKKAEVIALIKAGKNNVEISESTGINKNTVSAYRKELKEEEMIDKGICCDEIPDGFEWKWPLTVNMILGTAQPVPKHSKKAELEYLQA